MSLVFFLSLNNMQVSCVCFEWFFLSIENVSLVCMLCVIFISIETCNFRVYALNDFAIDRKMSVSCVCFEYLPIDRKNASLMSML